MADQIEFNIEEMRAHAQRLDGLATRAEDANTNAQGLAQGAGFDLYGLMCSPILVRSCRSPRPPTSGLSKH